MKILIVEDEMIISEDISMMLEERGYEVTDQVVNYEEAISSFIDNHPDLVLLDINLIGEKDGIEVAQKINDLGRIPFIYTSSLGDPYTIAKAKKTNPASYLIKPFKEEQLFASIEMAMANFSKVVTDDPENEKLPIFNNAIFVKIGHRYSKIKLSDIKYIQKSDNYIDIHAIDKKYIIRASIGNFIEQLGYDKIFRTHRSFAINIDYVTDVAPTIIMLGDTEIPLTKSYASDLIAHLRIF